MATTVSTAQAQKGVQFLLTHGGKLFLQLRDGNTENNPFRWALPGGGIEEGEDPYVAAYRELKEELGKEVRDHTYLAPLGTSPLGNSFFAGKIADPSKIVLREGAGCRFFSIEDIREMLPLGNVRFGIGGALRTRILRREEDFEHLRLLLERNELLPPDVFK